VVVDTIEVETSRIIHRFLHHPAFRTKSQRCGKVIKLSPRTIVWWEASKRGTHRIRLVTAALLTGLTASSGFTKNAYPL